MTTAALQMTTRSRRKPNWPNTTPTVFGIASVWRSIRSPVICGTLKMVWTHTTKSTWLGQDSTAVGSASWVRQFGTLKERVTWFNLHGSQIFVVQSRRTDGDRVSELITVRYAIPE